MQTWYLILTIMGHSVTVFPQSFIDAKTCEEFGVEWARPSTLHRAESSLNSYICMRRMDRGRDGLDRSEWIRFGGEN